MFRVNDKVRVNVNGPVKGASVVGLIVAVGAAYSVRVDGIAEGEEGSLIEASAADLSMVSPAAPRVLEGVSARFADGSVVAGTVTRVIPKGTTFDFRVDKATKRRRRSGADATEPDTYDYSPDPDGDEYTVRLHSDNNWYITKSDTKVTLGIRETVVKAAAAPAAEGSGEGSAEKAPDKAAA